MYIFYLLALLPVIVGAILYICNKEVIWKEWLLSAAISFALAGIMHLIVVEVMTSDYETWSGQVTDSVYMPKWHWEYTEIVTDYDEKGNACGSHIETHSGYNGPDWWVETTLGKNYITENKYNEIKHNFGDTVYPVRGYRPNYDSGDKNDYHIRNITNYIEPVNATYGFKNMFKASQNVMSFIRVPKDQKVYEYPKNPSTFISGRLLGGSANRIALKSWDQMNARLGVAKKVNVIMVEYPAGTSDIQGKYQQSKWLGGKKNDLVLCYSLTGKDVSWAYVFGWTERDIVKRNIETILLTNRVENGIIEKIEKEIQVNYQIKDWHKFDYLTLYPATGAIVIMIILMLGFQIGYWWWATHNEFEKD